MRGPARKALVVGFAFLLTGCISGGSFAGGRPLDSGDVRMGVGVMVLDGLQDTLDMGAAFPEIGARFGFGGGVDAGMKLLGVPPVLGAYFDARYAPPFPLAPVFGLGVSFFEPDREDESDDGSSVEVEGFGSALGWYPSLTLGSDRFYFGGRGMLLKVRQDDQPADWSRFIGVFAGASVGGTVRLVPELALYRSGHRIVPGAGLAIQILGKQSDDGS